MILHYPEQNIEVDIVKQGTDLLVRIYGGLAHIGSVAAAKPRHSLLGDGSCSSTVSVINYEGHKDDEIAVPVAKAVCAATQVNTVVVCGIHFDHIAPDMINDILTLPDKIAADIIRSYSETQ